MTWFHLTIFFGDFLSNYNFQFFSHFGFRREAIWIFLRQKMKLVKVTNMILQRPEVLCSRTVELKSESSEWVSFIEKSDLRCCPIHCWLGCWGCDRKFRLEEKTLYRLCTSSSHVLTNSVTTNIRFFLRNFTSLLFYEVEFFDWDQTMEKLMYKTLCSP